jgi:hypothetical protein
MILNDNIVDCGGGIAMNGSNAFFTPNSAAIDVAVDAGIKLYSLNFKMF